MGTLITDGFDAGDDEKIVSILNKWKGGPLSDRLFTSVSKLTPQVSVITTIFRKRGDIIETLLLPRPSDDPLWPNMLNLPGKMFRAMDFERVDGNPMNGPLKRIQNDELKIKFESVKFIDLVFQNIARGHIVVLLHIGELSDNQEDKSDWVWADVTRLKELNNFLETETSAIEVGLKHYLASSNHLPSL